MSDSKPKPSAATDDYDVGYRKPPKQHRFVKGQSGNPMGRRRNASRKTSPDLFEEQMKGLIIEEAYRKIAVREGDAVVQVSAVQAAMRGLAISAAKGDLRAQREILSLLRWVESDRRALKMEFFKQAIEYKVEGEAWLERCRLDGTTGPEPIPHPDDIEIDFCTGEVRCKGPITKQQKDAQDQLIAMRPITEKCLRRVERGLAKNPDDRALLKNLRELRQTLKWIAIVEGLVRERASKN